MRRPVLLTALLLIGGCSATREEPVERNEPAVLSASAAYELPQPGPDAIISYGDDPRHFGELRLPDGPGPFGVAIIVHGGCWLSAYDQSYMAALAEAVTGLGLASWTIAYRRVGEPGGGWPNTFLDAGAAVDHLRVVAEEHPLDTDRVFTVGHSAGGQLALWLAGRPALAPSSPLYSEDPLPVAGVLALAAAADLAFLAERGDCGDAATLLMGGKADEFAGRYSSGSPVSLVPLRVPQILVNGRLDERWSAPADRYLQAAQLAGDPIERREAPDAGHFELVVPGGSTWPIVRGALEDLIDRSASTASTQ
ncbi:MAG: alpha/beta hydrolase family protein [Candidatus Wenzhouxiangella sp. M2_3B_020]